MKKIALAMAALFALLIPAAFADHHNACCAEKADCCKEGAECCK